MGGATLLYRVIHGLIFPPFITLPTQGCFLTLTSKAGSLVHLSYLFILMGGCLFYYIVMVSPIYQHESAIGTHVSPHPEPSSHTPPHTTPPGFSRAPALGARLHALNWHWSSVFTYGNVHVSMRFSQIILHCPSPTESESLFFMLVFPLLCCM